MTTKLKKVFYQYDEKIFELEDWERLHRKLYDLAMNSKEESQELYEVFEAEKDIEMQISLALILAELGNRKIKPFVERIFLGSKDMHHIIEACVMYIVLDEPIGKEKLIKLASTKKLPPPPCI